MQETDSSVNCTTPVVEKGGNSDKTKRFTAYFLRIIFSILIITIILKTTDGDRIFQDIRSLSLRAFIAAYITVLLGAFPSAYAWKIILRIQKMNISFWKLAQMNLSGFFLNSYLPTGVSGDIWRGYALSKASRNTARSVASVIIERFTAFGSIILLGFVSFLFNMEKFRAVGILNQIALFFSFLLIVFIVGSLFLFFFLEKGICVIKRFIPKVETHELAENINNFRKEPAKLITALLFTSISPILECFTYIIIIHAFRLNAPILPILSFVPILRFINHIPVTINSVGTQDIATILFWQPLGLSPEQALSISFTMHILRLSVGATGGIIYALFPYDKNDKGEKT